MQKVTTIYFRVKLVHLPLAKLVKCSILYFEVGHTCCNFHYDSIYNIL